MQNIKGEAENVARCMLRFGSARLIYFARGRDASSAISFMEETTTSFTTALHRILPSHEIFSMSPVKICTDFNCGASLNSFNTSVAPLSVKKNNGLHSRSELDHYWNFFIYYKKQLMTSNTQILVA